MSSLAVVQQDAGSIIESVIAKGDLSKLEPEDRARYYVEVCQSMGLNPLTKPFDYITLNSKLTLYATKAATDQLRGLRGVTVEITSRERIDDLYVVTASARTPDGREDSDIGAVNVKGLAGDNLANAMMKATTKAKRRVTLSLCGLGWVDESEVDSIPNAVRPVVDIETGEILDDGTRTAHIRELRDEHEAEKAMAVAHDNTAKATKEQLQNILDLGHALGMSDEKVAEYCGKPGKDLTAAEAEQIRKELNDDLEKRIKADEERAAAAAQK